MGIVDGFKNFVSGAGAFQKRYDEAALTQDLPQTNISDLEFTDLRKLFLDAKGSSKLTDGQSDALNYIKSKDPALAKVLSMPGGGRHQDYSAAITERANAGLPLPGNWDKDTFKAAPTFTGFSDGLQRKLKGVAAELDTTAEHVGSAMTIGQGLTALQGLVLDEKELDELKKAGLTPGEAVGLARSAH